MQRNQSDQGSFHEDNFFNFSAMDSASGNGEADHKTEPQNHMDMQQYQDYTHNDTGQDYPDVSDNSMALVEKMMADLRRASTGGGGMM